MKIFEKIMNIIFYIITSFCVIFTFQYISSLNYGTFFKTIIFLLFIIYLFSYFCHNELKEKILKTDYVEKENYDVILKELLKHLNHKN